MLLFENIDNGAKKIEGVSRRKYFLPTVNSFLINQSMVSMMK